MVENKCRKSCIDSELTLSNKCFEAKLTLSYTIDQGCSKRIMGFLFVEVFKHTRADKKKESL